MVGTRSEDTLLFLGLTPKVIKIKHVVKMLEEFAEKKQYQDLSDRFNVILFQESGPVYLDEFTLNFENITNLIEDYRKERVRANIAGGIFVAATFIIEVYKKISDKAFRLIIFTDKGSLKIPDNYVPVLENLLDKVKDMPFFIDVLRIGTDDPVEDEKLYDLARKCNGDLYHVKKPKELHETLLKLAEKKMISDGSSFSLSAKSGIALENKDFYENLADDPNILLEPDTCSICFKKDDKTVVECPVCKTKAHMACWAHWAKTSNIGIPYVFRCHQCFDLVKLDENFVKIVQTGAEPAPEIPGTKVDLVSYLRNLESQRVVQVVQDQDPLQVEADDEEFEEDFVFSNEIEEEVAFSSPVENSVEAPQLSRRSRRENQQRARTLQPIPRPQEAPREKKEKKKVEVTVVFCPSCSKINTSQDRYCKYCGFKLF